MPGILLRERGGRFGTEIQGRPCEDGGRQKLDYKPRNAEIAGSHHKIGKR